MNKNIKRAVIFSIMFTAISSFTPSTLSIGNQYAYAYSDEEITKLGLSSGVSIITAYTSASHKWDYRIKSGDKVPIVIYSKLSSDQTNIKLNTIETKAADIRVFVGKEQIKLADIYSQINVAEGEKKSIYIRLYDSKSYADNKYTSEYELIVEREVSDDSDVDDNDVTLRDYDDVYLTRLELYNNDKRIDLNFDKTQPVYNLNVDNSFSYIRIKAVPEQENYKLIINDKDIDTKGSNKDIRDVPLDEGLNPIKIRIISSDHKRREYFLNVTREKDTQTTSNSNNTTNNNPSINETPQNSQAQTTGSWQYKKADGTLATGWTLIGNDWYYFDESGTMKTGWIKDSSGRWYYLDQSGIMVKNTVVDGYKIEADGCYIGK